MRPDTEEALRYLGAGENAPAALRRQVDAAAAELAVALQPRYTYRVFDLEQAQGGVRLLGTGLSLTGETAARLLAPCHQAVLLACTLGAAFDARLLAAQARDMARAVILDACGSAFVESGCDAAEQEIAARFPGRYLTDRFSPGYGDLPLSLQPAICGTLDTPRRLGVQVTESCLMTPAKSVTAVIGLSDVPQPARIRGCAFCSMRDTCQLRKGGKRCAL
ncbi:MAG: vitamin B12 dependent-methionine synthase activation domain-containing protein [Oscillospiraceae bacterium]